MDYGVLGKKNDLHAIGSTPEDSMKYSVKFTMSRDAYERNIYLESAKRVVFRNCMEKLGLDDKSLTHFNRDFYYNKPELQEELATCVNVRMAMHFGTENAIEKGIGLNFKAMFAEYQEYEQWHPMKKHMKPYVKG